MKVVRLQPYAPAAFTPRKYTWYSFVQLYSSPKNGGIFFTEETELTIANEGAGIRNEWQERDRRMKYKNRHISDYPTHGDTRLHRKVAGCHNLKMTGLQISIFLT
jgi:hypothetical protein